MWTLTIHCTGKEIDRRRTRKQWEKRMLEYPPTARWSENVGGLGESHHALYITRPLTGGLIPWVIDPEFSHYHEIPRTGAPAGYLATQD